MENGPIENKRKRKVKNIFGHCSRNCPSMGKFAKVIIGRSSYHGVKESNALLDACQCCGNPSTMVIHADGFPGMSTIALCSFCEGAHFEMADGYLQIVCPFHDIPGIAAMVYYWKAIDAFNKSTGKKKRGKRVNFGVDWTVELEKLRALYKEETT